MIPEDLLYDLEYDVWVRLVGDEATVGMTDVAQTRCGRLVQVSWKPPGRQLRRGRPLCVIESSKWVGPVISPLTGPMVACNEERFRGDVAIANRDPYGDGWLVRIRLEEAAPELALLSDGSVASEHYRQIIEEEKIHCIRCAG